MNDYYYNVIKPSRKNIADDIANDYVMYYLCRLSTMVRYRNLPNTIDHKYLELLLMKNGYIIFSEKDGKMYALNAGLGGVPDYNYQPTTAIITNPYLQYYGTKEIGKDCEIVYNDSLKIGLIPLLSKYSYLMADNMITLRLADIFARVTALISASDDKTKNSAEEFIRSIEKGELSVIAENPFLEGIKAQPLHNGASTELTNIIEVQQYLKASLYNDLGLQSNFNMKREAIMAGEASMNEDALSPLIDDMMQERIEGIDRVNKMFGTDIKVELNPDSAWGQRERSEKANVELQETSVKLQENEVENTDPEKVDEQKVENEEMNKEETEEVKDPEETVEKGENNVKD